MEKLTKIEEIFQKILNDSSQVQELLKQETVDDMYSFILTKDNTISKDDFDAFIAEMLENYKLNLTTSELSTENLGNIAGGINIGTKLSAAALSILTMMPGMASAAEPNKAGQAAPTSSSTSVIKQDKSKIDSAAESTANWFEQKGWAKTANWIRNNPKMIAIIPSIAAVVIAAAGVSIGVAVHRHNKSREISMEDFVPLNPSSSSSTSLQTASSIPSPLTASTVTNLSTPFSPTDGPLRLPPPPTQITSSSSYDELDDRYEDAIDDIIDDKSGTSSQTASNLPLPLSLTTSVINTPSAAPTILPPTPTQQSTSTTSTTSAQSTSNVPPPLSQVNTPPGDLSESTIAALPPAPQTSGSSSSMSSQTASNLPPTLTQSFVAGFPNIPSSTSSTPSQASPLNPPPLLAQAKSESVPTSPPISASTIAETAPTTFNSSPFIAAQMLRKLNTSPPPTSQTPSSPSSSSSSTTPTSSILTAARSNLNHVENKNKEKPFTLTPAQQQIVDRRKELGTSFISTAKNTSLPQPTVLPLPPAVQRAQNDSANATPAIMKKIDNLSDSKFGNTSDDLTGSFAITQSMMDRDKNDPLIGKTEEQKKAIYNYAQKRGGLIDLTTDLITPGSNKPPVVLTRPQQQTPSSQTPSKSAQPQGVVTIRDNYDPNAASSPLQAPISQSIINTNNPGQNPTKPDSPPKSNEKIYKQI